MKEMLNELEKAGIRVSHEGADCEFTVTPSYKGNIGFFHLLGQDWELIVVKGVYKDNIRRLKGKPPYDDRKINEVAQTLSDVERTLRKRVIIKIIFNEEQKHVINYIEADSTQLSRDDARDFTIPAPITSVERSLGKDISIGDKQLFSKAPFAEILPETLSPFAMSLVSMMPDVMNPLFMSSSIKTLSPSVKLLFGRLYMNIANASTITSKFSQPSDFLMMNFVPALFKSVKKPSIGVPNDADLKISDDEILESIKDIADSIADLKPEDVYSDEFIELIALTVMTWEMVYVRLWKSFTNLHKLISKDIDTTLTHIYKTRSNSILNIGFDKICTCFDPAIIEHKIESIGLKHLSIDYMYKTFPTSKRLTLSKSKYAERITEAHSYLKMRDDLYLAISAMTSKVRSLLLESGTQLHNDQMLSDKNDIFLFEVTEIRNIIGDEFYGNIPFTTNFRRWQNARFSALCLPFNLYEKDVVDAEKIALSQIDKSTKEKNLPCLSLFHKEITTSNFTTRMNFRLHDIKEAVGKDVVITESASLFSFITEYCATTETPLYTGARFANIMIQDKTITTTKDSIKF
ncbi:MAG: hypothetical protein C0603_10895 [Denitrovibrio sp.]|nr:MAG: hypothetical protein C0603_10895 [Denitrovibrio sp.]